LSDIDGGKIQHFSGYHQGKFDAFEVPADQLADFVEWAVTTGKAERGFGCFALDSFGNYFGARYADLVRRVREKSGDPAALPSGEQTLVRKRVYRHGQSCASAPRTVRLSASTGADSRKSPSLGGPFPGRLPKRCGTRDAR